ncbi:MAG: metal-dependent transcriptional regulator [Ruminococcus sp.]|nr:metal-dependent transcriptional regulator [Ruminococcus sp.]
MAITEAVENYLETILILSKAQPDVHAIDICSYLGYSRPTVSIILKKMKDEGLVNVNDDNHITLTDEGKAIAERIFERHNLLSAFFIYLGVKKDQALEDACKIEHDLSQETYDLLKKHYEKLTENSGNQH